MNGHRAFSICVDLVKTRSLRLHFSPRNRKSHGSAVACGVCVMLIVIFLQGCSSKTPAPVVAPPQPPPAVSPSAQNPQTVAQQQTPQPAAAANKETENKPDANGAKPPQSNAKLPDGKVPDAKAGTEAKEVIHGNYHVDFSSDGHYAVSGGKNATIRMYDIDKGVLSRTFTGQKDAVTSIAFNAGATTIAAGSVDGRLMTWDARTVDGLDETERDSLGSDERVPVIGHEGPVTSLTFRLDGREIASGGEDGTIRYWRMPFLMPESVWTADSSVSMIEVVPQSNSLIAGKSDGSAELWELGESQTTVSLLPPTSREVTAVATDEEGFFVAVGDDSGKLRVMDLKSKAIILDTAAHEGAVTAIKFRPKKPQLLTVGADGATHTFDLQTGSTNSGQTVLHSFQSKGRLLAVSHGGGYAAMAGSNTVEVADLKSRTLLQTLSVDGKDIVSLAWSAEDRSLVAGDSGGGMHVWRIPGGQKVFDSHVHEGAVSALAGNALKSTIVSGGADAKIRVWHQPGIPDVVAGLDRSEATQMAVSPTGQLIAVASKDGLLRVVEVDKKSVIATYQGVGKSLNGIAWSQSGEWLACGGNDGVLRVWNVPQGAGSLATLEAGAGITRIAFHPSGPTLIAGLQNGHFKTWKLPFQKSQSLAGHTDTITSIKGNRVDSLVVTGGNDRVCRLFDVDRGESVRVFEGAQDSITSVVQAPNGQWIAAGDRAGQISMWNSSTGELIGAVQTFDVAVNSLDSDSSNKFVASASADGLVRIWQRPFVPPVPMNGTAQESVVLALSPDAKRIALGLADGSIIIRDTRTAEQIQVLTGHTKAITALGWSADSVLVASSSLDETVALWRIADRQRLVKWEGHAVPNRAVAVSANAEELRACSADGRLVAYTRTSSQQRVLLAPQNGLTAIAISPNGLRLALAGADGSVMLVNCETGERLHKTPSSDSVTALAWCDDEYWVSLDANRFVKYWNSTGVDAARGWPNAPKGLTKFCVSSDGSRLLATAADGRPQLWDAEGHVLQTFAWDPKISIQALALSTDGKTAVVTGQDGTTTSYQSPLVGIIKAHLGPAELVSFVDEKVILSAGADQKICAWNRENGTQIRQFMGCPGQAIEMAVSKAADKLVVLADNKKIYAWNLTSGEPVVLPPAIQDGSFRRIGLNADGQRLVVLDGNRRLRIQQLSDMSEIGEMASPANDVTSIAFLRSGAVVCASETLAFIARGGITDPGFQAHTGATVGLAAIPGKDEIVTAGEDGKIKVWSVNGVLIRTLAEVDSPIRTLAVSHDGNELTSLSADNKLRTWNYSGESIGGWPVGQRLTSLYYTGQTPSTVVTTSESQFRFYHSAKGKAVLTLTSPEKITASAIGAERKLLYAVNVEGSLISYPLEASKAVDSDQREIESLAISRNGESLASGGEDASVCVWKTATMKMVCRLKGHTKPVDAVSFGKEESLVISMSSDKSIRTWNVPESKQVRSIAVSAAPLSLSLSPDGKNVAVATKEKVVSVYDVQTGKAGQTTAADNALITSAQYTPRGLMTLNADKRLNVSEAKTRQFPLQTGPLTSLDVLRDGSYFVTAGPNAGLKLFDYNGKDVAEFESSQSAVKLICLSSDSQWLAGINPEGPTANVLTVWNVADRKSATTIPTPSSIRAVKFEPDSVNLMALCEDGMFRRYQATDGRLLEVIPTVERVSGGPTFLSSEELLTLESDQRVRIYRPSLSRVELAHTGAVTSLIYNSAGFLLSGGADGRVVAWGETSGKPVVVFQAGKIPVTDLCVTPNQENLIATYADDAVRIWSLKKKGADPDVIFMHKAPVNCARTSLDGTLMASGGMDKTVHLWMMATGRELVQFRGHEAAINRLVISPDNKQVVSFGDEGAIRVWKVPEDIFTSKSMGQVDKSQSVELARPEDAEIDRLSRNLKAFGQSPNRAEDQQRLDALLRGGTMGASSLGAKADDKKSIERDIALVEKKIRTSIVASQKSRLRKQLTELKLKKNIENSEGGFKDRAREELERFLKTGENPVLDFDSERPPGITASIRSIKTNFEFDAEEFHPVRLAINSGRDMIAMGRGPITIRKSNKVIPAMIQLYDRETGSLLRSWRDIPIVKFSSITFANNGKVVLTAPDVNAFQIYTGSSKPLANNSLVSTCPRVELKDNAAREIGNMVALGLATQALEGTPIVRFWDSEDTTFRTKSVPGYDSKITALAFNPKDKTVFYSERRSRQHMFFEVDPEDISRNVLIEKYDHAEMLGRLGSDGLGVEALCVSYPDAKYVVSYGKYEDRKYRFNVWQKTEPKKGETSDSTRVGHGWSLIQEKTFETAILRNNDPSKMWLINGTKFLCLEDTTGMVNVFDISNWKLIAQRPLKRARWGFPETAHSENGELFVWGDDRGHLEVWNMKSDLKKPLKEIDAHLGPIVGLAIGEDIKESRDEKSTKDSSKDFTKKYWIISAGEENFIKVWDQDTNKKIGGGKPKK